ncbi:MAG: histidine kinase dimerization/phosphoacceptor domain -containing protein [Methanothermobacter sp.]|nr:histidine kinase dimerization/phosphoacceptor domain -containing protein [Methanothermobacter sp.]
MHLLAAVSILSIYPGEGVVAPFHSKYAGGQMARKLIPSLVTIILIIGPVILSLREHLPFPSGIFLLAMALATSLFMISVAVERLNRMDQKRAKSHQEALNAWKFFEGVVENIGDAIAVLDKKGKTIYKNKQMEKLNFKIQDYWEKLKDTPVHIKKDNRYFTGWVVPLDKEKSIISLTEITDLIKAQKQLKETIKEKDALLRELHHRIKNNLQIIISLLNLQAQKADPKTKKVLSEVQNRIKSMATIHETLYETKTHKIDMQKYTEKLTNSLKTQHKNIKFQTNCKTKLNLETSIPLAMLINELLQQSIKTKPTKIKTKIQKHKKEHKLTITHNGTPTSHPGGGGDQKPPDKSTNTTTRRKTTNKKQQNHHNIQRTKIQKKSINFS